MCIAVGHTVQIFVAQCSAALFWRVQVSVHIWPKIIYCVFKYAANTWCEIDSFMQFLSVNILFVKLCWYIKVIFWVEFPYIFKTGEGFTLDGQKQKNFVYRILYQSIISHMAKLFNPWENDMSCVYR